MADHKIKYVSNPLKGINWLEGQPYAKSSSEEGARERGDRVSAQRRRGGRETSHQCFPFLVFLDCLGVPSASASGGSGHTLFSFASSGLKTGYVAASKEYM